MPKTKLCRACKVEIEKGANPYCSYTCKNSVASIKPKPTKKKAPSKPKKAKKPSLSKLRNKADNLASKYYRQQTPYCQAKAFSNIPCNGILQWCHIYSRGVSRLRYEPYNNLIMCGGHHMYFTYHPVEWVDFCDAHFKDKIDTARAHRYEYFKPTAEHYLKYIDLFKSVV